MAILDIDMTGIGPADGNGDRVPLENFIPTFTQRGFTGFAGLMSGRAAGGAVMSISSLRVVYGDSRFVPVDNSYKVRGYVQISFNHHHTPGVMAYLQPDGRAYIGKWAGNGVGAGWSISRRGAGQYGAETILAGEATPGTPPNGSLSICELDASLDANGHPFLILRVDGVVMQTWTDDDLTNQILDKGEMGFTRGNNNDTCIITRIIAEDTGVAPNEAPVDETSEAVTSQRTVTHNSEVSDDSGLPAIHHRVISLASVAAPTAENVAAGELSTGPAPSGDYLFETADDGDQSSMTFQAKSFDAAYRVSSTQEDDQGLLSPVEHHIIEPVQDLSGDDEVIFQTTASNVQAPVNGSVIMSLGLSGLEGLSPSQIRGLSVWIHKPGNIWNGTMGDIVDFVPTGAPSVRQVTIEKDAAGYGIENNDIVLVLFSRQIVSASLPTTVIAQVTSGVATEATLAAVLDDTTTALPDLMNALGVLMDAIKTKTDSLTFTSAGEIDANAKSINNESVKGNGRDVAFNTNL